MQGRIQDFKLGEGALKKIATSGGRLENVLGYFVWKITILRQKFLFFPILGGGGGRTGCVPHWIRPCYVQSNIIKLKTILIRIIITILLV
jgi:hypothetical protein